MAAHSAGTAKMPEDGAETPAQPQQRAADKRTRDTAEAAHAQHPADAGGPRRGGITARDKGIEARLRAADKKARGKDQDREPARQRPSPCDTMMKTAPSRYPVAITRDGWPRSMLHPIRIAPMVPPTWNIAVTSAAVVIVRPASFIRIGSHPVSR